MVFYGIIPLCFTYYVQAGEFTLTAFMLSLAMGFLSTNILIVNNIRDVEQDAPAGKRTTIVMFGCNFGTTLYLINSFLAVAAAWPLYLYRSRDILLLFLFFLLLELFAWQDVRRLQGSALNRLLGQTARNVLIYALLLVSILVF